jgi:hypothetical protein
MTVLMGQIGAANSFHGAAPEDAGAVGKAVAVVIMLKSKKAMLTGYNLGQHCQRWLKKRTASAVCQLHRHWLGLAGRQQAEARCRRAGMLSHPGSS